MNGSFISQGVLQGNQQIPLLLQQSRVPSDPILDPGKDTVESAVSHGEENIFTLKKMSSDMKRIGTEEDSSLLNVEEPSKGLTSEKPEQKKAESKEKSQKKNELHSGGECPMGLINYSGGLMCHQSDDGIKISVSVGTGKENDLTSAFLSGNKVDVPSAEAAMLTAQTIVEQDLSERKTDKYSNLHRCSDASKIIPTTVGADIKLEEIVVKNDPLTVIGE